jgi:ABC-2 type transport system permease protein
MSTVWLLVRREFSARVRARGYMLLTVIGLLAIVGLAFAPAIIDVFSLGDRLALAVVDETSSGTVGGLFFKRLETELADVLPNGESRYTLGASDVQAAELDAEVTNGDLDGYVLIRQELTATSQEATELRYAARLVSKEPLPDQDLARLSAALSAAATYVRLEQLGVGEDKAAGLFSPVEVQTQTLMAMGAESESEHVQSYALTYVLVLLLYMTVAVHGSYVALGVIEEKSSHVVEILLSTARPFQIMAGKLLGVGLTALSQYAVWMVAGALIFVLRGASGGFELGGLEVEVSAVSPGVLASFLVFFVLGFFTYAAVLATAGSLVSRTEDAQQVSTPVIIPLLVVFILSIWAMGNPDAPLSVALSLVSFASPVIMFVRIGMSEPPMWQILAAVAVNLVTIAGLVWVAARIFRASILLYGRKPSIRRALRALR